MTPVEQLQSNLVGILTNHIEPLFKDGTRLTIIARTPDNDNADVLVSNDDMDGLAALIERSKAREALETAP